MRFHIGFSKRISKKTIIFILGLLSMALAMFFGNTEIVFADQVTINAQPGYYAYYRDNSSTPIIPSVTCNTNHCVYSVSNYNGFNGYNFTYSYDLASISCSSRKADIIFNAYLRNTSGGALQENMNISGVTNGTAQALSMEYGGIQFKLRGVNLDRTITFVTNASGSPTTQVGAAWILARVTYECITDQNAAINSAAQDIMQNDNQNTQSIIDSFEDSTQDIINNQNDSNTSSSQSSANTFFNNFQFNDTRGLTSVITSPIRLLQGIINSTDSCSDYTFSISMLGTQTKQVSLPSGCILWNNVPQQVVLAYWIIVWAIVGYRALIDMIHFASSLRDPDKKNDYTLDL